MRLFFFHEYPPQPNERMMGDLRASLAGCLPPHTSVFKHGLLKSYRPGALRPDRLVNMAYLFIALPIWLASTRPNWVITVTTPPLVQIWLALWAPLFRFKLICWLMDYHPELEARALQGRLGGRILAGWLRLMDRGAMRRMSLVVALDEAMAKVARSRGVSVPVVVHPTWDTQGQKSPGRVAFHDQSKVVSLLYGGNLGAAHELGPLKVLLMEVMQLGRSVRILATGGSDEGNRRFQQLTAETGCQITLRERVPFSELRTLCDEHQVQAGVVLMRSSAAGLVSPSKFSAYLQLGLPTLYLGPQGTNADVVCRRFGAGIGLEPESDPAVMSAVAQALVNPAQRRVWWESVPRAAEHFARHNADSLARLLRDFILGEPDQTFQGGRPT